MVIKGYSAFPKAPTLLKPHHQIVLCHIHDTLWRSLTPLQEMQSVYSAAPADWATIDNMLCRLLQSSCQRENISFIRYVPVSYCHYLINYLNYLHLCFSKHYDLIGWLFNLPSSFMNFLEKYLPSKLHNELFGQYQHQHCFNHYILVSWISGFAKVLLSSNK